MNSAPHALTKNIDHIGLMNLAIGRKFNTNFDEIFSDLGKGEVNENSLKYLELLDKAKYSFPVTYIDNKSIPTLCIYGGQDEYIGVAYYALLKKTFLMNNNKDNITLVYYKYGHHNVYDPVCEDQKNASNKEGKILSEYIQKYLTQDN